MYVGRNVDRLHRRNRAVPRRRDALLQVAHLRRERRLVPHRARHAAEQRRHLRARLREAEDVVDEHEHVRVFNVAEVFSHRETGQTDAKTCARRLVHLAVDQRAGVDDARLLHLEVEIVSFARALTDAAEHRLAAVSLGDVVDQLHDDDGLAHAGAAEQTDLTAFTNGETRSTTLMPVSKISVLGSRFTKSGRLRWIGQRSASLRDRGAIVHRLTEARLRMRPSAGAPTGTVIVAAGCRRPPIPRTTASVDDIATRAHLVAADVLLHLDGDPNGPPSGAVARDLERVVELRQVLSLELDVENRPMTCTILPML